MPKAEVEARRIRAETGASDLPIDVERVAARLGAEVVFEPMSRDLSGLLYRDGERTVIGVNSVHAPARQRFTIAHEVGHLVLHAGRPVVLDHVVRLNFRDPRSGTATDAEEIAANAFAAELLMPRELVIAEVGRARARGDALDPSFVRALAVGFDVSGEAMGNRLANLGLISQL